MLESLFNKVAECTPKETLSQGLFYDFCEILKNTYFLIIRQNQTTLQRKQISKVTQLR